jgi:hypothetical protein
MSGRFAAEPNRAMALRDRPCELQPEQPVFFIFHRFG